MATVTSICVYCGSRFGAAPAFRSLAERLGDALGRRGVRLVYGGGHIGIMGVVADAVLAAGGQVIGVIPRFLHEREVAHEGVSELIVVDDMHSRKRKMFELADAFVALPGGLGTLDEIIEIATWKQLGQHSRPVVLLNQDGYWQPLLALIEHIIARGFADASAMELLSVARDLDHLFDLLASAPEEQARAHVERF